MCPGGCVSWRAVCLSGLWGGESKYWDLAQSRCLVRASTAAPRLRDAPLRLLLLSAFVINSHMQVAPEDQSTFPFSFLVWVSLVPMVTMSVSEGLGTREIE